MPTTMPPESIASIQRAASMIRHHLARELRVFVWPMPLRRSTYSPGGQHLGLIWCVRIGLEQDGWCAGTSRHVHYSLPDVDSADYEAARAAIAELLEPFSGLVSVVEASVDVGGPAGPQSPRVEPIRASASKRYMNASHYARFQRANRANRRVYRRGGPTLG
jgi:hypothetical protein